MCAYWNLLLPNLVLESDLAVSRCVHAGICYFPTWCLNRVWSFPGVCMLGISTSQPSVRIGFGRFPMCACWDLLLPNLVFEADLAVSQSGVRTGLSCYS